MRILHRSFGQLQVGATHLLLGLVLLQVALCVQAGLFDFIQKNDKPTTAVGRPTSSRASHEELIPADEETERLSRELNSMSDTPLPRRRRARVATDLNSLLEAKKNSPEHARPTRRPRRPRPVVQDDDLDQEAAAQAQAQDQAQAQEEVQLEADQTELVHKPASGAVHNPGESPKPSIVMPRINLGNRPYKKPPSANKLLSSTFLKEKMKAAYKVGKNAVTDAIVDLPKYVDKATDTLQALLKLDSKGRLLALIDEAKGEIHNIRREYSSFSIAWSPMMEQALNYLGADDLYHAKHNPKDSLDFRHDALIMLAFGYELMNIMIIWREHMLVAAGAYKFYLEDLKRQFADPDQEAPLIDEDYIYALHNVHNYLMFTTWLEMNQLMSESRTKLDFLMEKLDEDERDYEREYFRYSMFFQEVWDSTEKAFAEQDDQITKELVDGGDNEIFEQINAFFRDFKNLIADGTIRGVDWEVPKEMKDFMERMRVQLQYNPRVYTKRFLKELSLMKQQEMQGDTDYE